MKVINGKGRQDKANWVRMNNENGLDANGRGAAVSESEVMMVGKRRQFSVAYKRRILAEAEACGYGELGALLRREGIYSSNLNNWRREEAVGKLAGKRKKRKVNQKRIEQLEKENAHLQRELSKAQAIITAQKKWAELIDIMNKSE